MRTVLVSALAFGALTSVALAEEPVVLTDAQMDEVTAGQVGVCVVCLNLAIAIAANVGTADSEATATTGRQMVRASRSSTLVLAIPIDRFWQFITEHVRPGETTTFEGGHNLLRFSAPSIQPTTRRT